jgi:uncharacterized protein involved in response to NO
MVGFAARRRWLRSDHPQRGAEIGLIQVAEPLRRPPPASGNALLALGFRPFYLLAGSYAALSVPIWAAQYAGWLPGANALLHAHEMLFGFAFAVISGFLLTAVRAWTGRPTPSGAPLAGIALLWIAGRLLAPAWWQGAALADAAFALAVAWGIGRPLIASGNRRNWFFIALVFALGAAGMLFRYAPRTGLVLGLDVILFIIAVMAGRVVPAFTNNAISDAGARRNPVLETAALASILLLLALDALQLPVAPVALVAAIVHAMRLALWAPWATRKQPILWILHLSYAWIVVHLALRGLGELELVAPLLATHALTVGAIGGLTLGMMTRTSRGHTARPLKVGAWEISAYVLVQAAALVRVFVPVALPDAYLVAVLLSAALWCAAFSIFTVVYFPILTRARLDGQPG